MDKETTDFAKMQEKIQIISPIKQRILYYIDFLNVSKRKFYEKTTISRGTIESSSGITEEILAKFIATYKEVSIIWLITGEGEMLSENNTLNNSNDMDCSKCPYQKDIERYQRDLARYEKLIDALQASDNPQTKQKCA